MADKRKKGRLFLKSLLINLGIPVILFMLVVLFTAKTYYGAFYKNQLITQQYIGQYISESLKGILSQKQQILEDLSRLPATIVLAETAPGTLDWNKLHKVEAYNNIIKPLQGLMKEGDIDLLYFASSKSPAIFANREPELPPDYDARTRSWYTGAVDSRGFYITDPYVTAEKDAAKQITISFSYPILDKGSVVGVTAMDYSMSSINAYLAREMEKKGVTITLYSSRRAEILWSKKTEGKIIPLAAMAAKLGYDEAGAKKLIGKFTSGEPFSFTGNSIYGKQLIASLPIAGTPWGILIGRPVKYIRTSVIASIFTPAIIFVVILFFAALVVSFILTILTIVKPLNTASDMLGELAEKDADLTMIMDVKTNDDIGRLADNFNAFIEKLRLLINDIRTSARKAEEHKESIVSSSEETSSATHEISANISSMLKQMNSLDENIGTNATSIEEISSNIESFDIQIAKQTGMVEQSTSAITEMMASIQSVAAITQNKRKTTENLKEIAADGITKMDETSTGFKEVVSRVHEIKEMAELINGIASQTNLLSMNAAIEAAHAGDAGKGFAVVADEIRKLAESAAQSSVNITEAINKIVESVQTTDINVKNSADSFNTINREISDTVGAFQEIEASVLELNAGGQQILEASQAIENTSLSIRDGSVEIKTGIQAMLTTFEHIKEISEIVASGMAENNTGIREIVQAMMLIVEQSDKLSTILEELKDSVFRFTI